MRLQLQSQSVSNLISQLEEARASGILGSILDQIESGGSAGQIVALYTKFVEQPFLKSRFRAEHVRTIIREAMWPLRKPGIIFPGTLRKRQRVNRDTGGLLDEWDITQLESGGLVLRPDQALSARYWGIGFDLDSDENKYLLEEYLLGSSVNRLVHMLRSLELVETHFRRRHYENVHILPPRSGADFEQLVIDVLNEYHRKARHAPLVEDLLEKTDLRVHVQGVYRKRGARVQVTTTIDPLFYQSKLATINRLEEIVVLSPASIARFVNEMGKELGPSIIHNSGTALLKEQAIGIRKSLFVALEGHHKSPLGPLASVPENLRIFIREFIELEAARSTDALRDREVRKGKFRRVRRMARVACGRMLLSVRRLSLGSQHAARLPTILFISNRLRTIGDHEVTYDVSTRRWQVSSPEPVDFSLFDFHATGNDRSVRSSLYAARNTYSTEAHLATTSASMTLGSLLHNPKQRLG